MKKLDKFLVEMRPTPVDLFTLKYDFDSLNKDELFWLRDYLKKSIAGDDGSEQDQSHFEMLMEKTLKAVNANGTA